jgi:hypothetical protein
MKAWILLLLVLLGLVWGTMTREGSLQITIVIPVSWGPYYEWVLDFPAWRPAEEPPLRTEPVRIGEEYWSRTNSHL